MKTFRSISDLEEEFSFPSSSSLLRNALNFFFLLHNSNSSLFKSCVPQLGVVIATREIVIYDFFY